MFVDATKVLTNINGEAIQVPSSRKDADGRPVLEDATLGFAIVEALLADYPDDKPSGAEKVDRLDLAERFHKPIDGLPIKIDGKEAEKIKTLLSKRWGTLVAGRAIRMIEQSPARIEPKAVEAAE